MLQYDMNKEHSIKHRSITHTRLIQDLCFGYLFSACSGGTRDAHMPSPCVIAYSTAMWHQLRWMLYEP